MSWFPLPPPVVLYPIDETSYVKAGESITYTLELANYTGEIDSFNLDILPGNVWTTTLSTEQVGPIENGGNAYLTARVDVPPAAQAGDNSVATIQASSVTSPTVYTATSILDTIAYTSTSAYVITSHKLFLVDQFLYTSVGSIDLTQYGCMIAYKAILSPNIAQLYVACFQNQTIIVFNTFDNSYLTSITLPDWNYHGDITFTRDGAYAVVGGDSITDIYVIDTSTYSIVKTVHSFYTTSLATHPYLPYIYIGGFEGYNGFIQVLDTRTFTIDKTIGLGFIPARDVQCSPDGQWVYATGGVMIFKINAQTNEIVDQLTRPHDVYTLSVAPDSNKFFTSSAGGALEVFGAQSFTYITTIYLPDNLMMDLQFTCDGSELWAANGTEHMPVIDPNDYTIPHQILIPNEDPIGIAMCSPISTGVFARKAADLTHASPGEKVRYTISLYNYSPDNLDNALITDTLPITLNYMIGSLHSTSGNAAYQDGVITWTGPLTSSMSVDVDFTARVDQSVSFGDSITNSALFNIHSETYTRSATINIVPYQLLMPCVTRACGPFYFDNFSDPNSGWPIEDTQHAVMGYRDGEYQIYVRDAGWLVFAYQDLGVTDYMVEMDTRPAAHLNGGTGIIFSLTESGFYLFEISDGWFSLWRYDPGGWAQMIGWRRSSALNPGFATNHLAVVRKQMEIRLYANSYLIGQTNDYTYSGTRVGMVSDAFTENYDGRFDNFAVTKGVCIGGYSSTLTPAATSTIKDFWFSQRPAPGWSVPFHDK